MELTSQFGSAEVETIPAGWKVEPVGEAFDICNSLRLPISQDVRKTMIGQYPYYGPTSVQGFINEYRVEGEFALIGEDGDHFLKWRNTPMTLLVSGKFNVNNHAHIVQGSKNLTSWFYYYFSHKDLTNYLTRQGAGRYKLTKRTLINIPCVLPPLPEQRAIAAALSDTDALLSSLDRLLAKKRDIKQAVMQQLLTGKQRLPGFSGEWEVKRLGEMGFTYGGLSGKSKADFGEGSSRYIPFMNIMRNVVIDPENLERVRVAIGEVQNIAKKGDLFFNGSSETPEEVGLCSVLLESLSDVYLNSFCFGYRLREGVESDGTYLAYFFRSNEGRKLVYSLAQGATRYNLSKSNFLKLKMPLPELPEQAAIAAVLSDIDAEIDALQQRRDKTRAIKQGMMQELLTGRTRLV